MENENVEPNEKGSSSETISAGNPHPEKDGVYSDDNPINKNSRNYMGKEEDEQGPNFDKKSKNADGDTGQNAGTFK